MTQAKSSRVRLREPDARELAVAALRGAGFDPGQAAILADHMMDAALCGYEYSGLPKILNLEEYGASHPPTGPTRLIHETPSSALYDGGGNNGMLTMYHATHEAIDKATAHGFAIVGVNNTWMSGRSAYYVELLARAGLVGIHTISSRPQVAPPGGAAAALGTNPIAFGFPTEGDPLLIDLGTSALMFTDLALRARRGERLPEGVAIDAQGRPTRDPALAQLGAALPLAGYKGFALGLAMQALGVLCSGGTDGRDSLGYLIIAMRPDLLTPLDEYRRNLSLALARIKATPRQPGVDEIRVPSERAFATRQRLMHEGIEIDQHIHDALAKLAARAVR
jgi:LDH2 family malate/lactate/ureidoglycolate dehydrogenase